MSYKQKLIHSLGFSVLFFCIVFMQVNVNVLRVTGENDGRPLLVFLVLCLPVTNPLKLARVQVDLHHLSCLSFPALTQSVFVLTAF